MRDILSTEPHVDDVGSRLWRGVEDVEGAVFVLDDFCLHFGPVRCDDDARDLPFTSTFCVHDKAHFLSDADGRPDARACEIKIRCSIWAEKIDGNMLVSVKWKESRLLFTRCTETQGYVAYEAVLPSIFFL